MDVTFKTNDFGDETASMQAAQGGGAPEEADHLWGHIILDHPGQAPVAIFDDLSMLGYALCVVSAGEMVKDGRSELRLVGWPGQFTFETKGSTVHVIGSQGEDATFPLADLLASVRACGLRLVDFMDDLSIANPQFAYSSQALRKALTQGA
jgi:hypothetical protein